MKQTRLRTTVLAIISVAITGCSALPSGPWSLPSSSTVESNLPGPASTGTALQAAQALPVAGPDLRAGYSRDQFGQSWSDDVDVAGGHNGCDQRSDILRRDLLEVTIKPKTRGCVPLAGTLHDPYTGQIIHFQRGAETSDAVQIDHVVALADAWRTGAQDLTAQRRQDFAGDPLNLWAVDGPTNQAKGDDDASAWLPPNQQTRCEYVARQVAVKTAHDLWVTDVEKRAITSALQACPAQSLPTSAGSAPPELIN